MSAAAFAAGVQHAPRAARTRPEIPAIPRLSRAAHRRAAPPPAAATPPGRGVAPRASRARETRARDFTPSAGRRTHGN
jgi:hypothetical protein